MDKIEMALVAQNCLTAALNDSGITVKDTPSPEQAAFEKGFVAGWQAGVDVLASSVEKVAASYIGDD